MFLAPGLGANRQAIEGRGGDLGQGRGIGRRRNLPRGLGATQASGEHGVDLIQRPSQLRPDFGIGHGRLDRDLTGREFLLDQFSVADAYLTTVLNWARFIQLDLTPYPAVAAYFERITARPQVARAMQEEFGLYQAARG